MSGTSVLHAEFEFSHGRIFQKCNNMTIYNIIVIVLGQYILRHIH